MMHFPLFQISSLFSKKFQTLWKVFKILPFPEKCLDFHPPKFLTTFSFKSSTTNFLFPPLFPCFSTFPPPPFHENYYSPLLLKIPPCFRKIHLPFTYFCVFLFPPTLTMMHLCITECTYWTPLPII